MIFRVMSGWRIVARTTRRICFSFGRSFDANVALVAHCSTPELTEERWSSFTNPKIAGSSGGPADAGDATDRRGCSAAGLSWMNAAMSGSTPAGAAGPPAGWPGALRVEQVLVRRQLEKQAPKRTNIRRRTDWTVSIEIHHFGSTRGHGRVRFNVVRDTLHLRRVGDEDAGRRTAAECHRTRLEGSPVSHPDE
jgi:hypothetical protein